MIEYIKNSKSIILFHLDIEGNVLYGNNAYKNILKYQDNNIRKKFINPVFEKMIGLSPGNDLIFEGIITFEKGKTDSSFCAKVFQEKGKMIFLCEYDCFEMESFFKEMSIKFK